MWAGSRVNAENWRFSFTVSMRIITSSCGTNPVIVWYLQEEEEEEHHHCGLPV